MRFTKFGMASKISMTSGSSIWLWERSRTDTALHSTRWRSPSGVDTWLWASWSVSKRGRHAENVGIKGLLKRKYRIILETIQIFDCTNVLLPHRLRREKAILWRSYPHQHITHLLTQHNHNIKSVSTHIDFLSLLFGCSISWEREDFPVFPDSRSCRWDSVGDRCIYDQTTIHYYVVITTFKFNVAKVCHWAE